MKRGAGSIPMPAGKPPARRHSLIVVYVSFVITIEGPPPQELEGSGWAVLDTDSGKLVSKPFGSSGEANSELDLIAAKLGYTHG